MSRHQCDAEMCAFWTGNGCICAVVGLDRQLPEPEDDDTGPEQIERA